MAFRFRKFRQSLRLIPTAKSLGFSTRVNEGDQAKTSSGSDGCVTGKPSFPRFCCHNTESYQTSAPSLKTSSQADALQLTDNLPMPISFTPPDVSMISLPRSENKVQCSQADFEHLMSTAKPVAFTCDDILSISEEFCGKNLSDTSMERSSVKVMMMSPLCGLNNSASKNLKDMSSNYRNSHGCNSHLPKNLHFSSMSDSDTFYTFLFSSPSKSSSNGDTPKNGPSQEQLHKAREKIERTIPVMFTGSYDYSILHKDVILENNLFGGNRIKKGVTSYSIEFLLMKARFYARFTSIKTEVLNVSTQEQNGVIRVHWRLRGLPQTQVLKFWRLFQSRREIGKDDWEWFEAFSYFHVGKDGLVHKHRLDRMLPDNEEPNKLSMKLNKFLNPAKPLVN